MNKVSFRTHNADVHSILMRILHDGHASLPNGTRIGDVKTILDKINASGRNVELIHETEGFVLRKVSGVFILPVLSKTVKK